MKVNRASQIAASPVMANVTYYDVPIYIESVSKENRTARIRPLDSPGSSRTVSVSHLIEHTLS